MLNLLLLFCFIIHSETPHVGPVDTIPVEGKKGGNVTLPCEYQAKDISNIRFIHYKITTYFSDIPVCQNKEYQRESGRVCTKGACGIVLKDLNFIDPGTYSLRFNYKNAPKELKYHLLIHDEISLNTGEKLKLDVLLINADKVERNSSGEWTEVWTRGHGVSSDRLTDSDGNLTINAFTSTDAGTYRVLDSEGETLITVTVTESATESKGKLENTDDNHKPDDTEPHTVESCIIVLCVIGALVVLVVAVIWIYKCRHRNAEHQVIPMQEIVQESRI